MSGIESRLRLPEFRWLHDYWLARRHGRRMPSRRDIDPLQMKPVIGHVALFDVLHDPLRFRFRLVGANITSEFRMDMTGRPVDEYPEASFREQLINGCTAVVALAKPRTAILERPDGDELHRYDTIALPLSDDDSTVTMLLTYQKRIETVRVG